MLRYRLLDHALAARPAPDAVLRAGSRLGAWARVRRESRGGVVAQEARLRALIERMSTGPIAEVTDKANEQHYELPADFFALFLGPRRKYSGCLWAAGVRDLAGAEEAMLALTCERAGIADGMTHPRPRLRLGLALAVARRAVPGRAHPRGLELERPARVDRGRGRAPRLHQPRDRHRGRQRLRARGARFDRVMSIEMFEHMRNWKELLRRISTWLKPDGKLFVHVFSHRTLPYLFQGTWAAERFFTAGLMPRHDLMPRFSATSCSSGAGPCRARTTRGRWRPGSTGSTRAPTRRCAARPRPRRVGSATLLGTWRLFLLSTNEIWKCREGNRWLVSHYLLSPRGETRSSPPRGPAAAAR